MGQLQKLGIRRGCEAERRSTQGIYLAEKRERCRGEGRRDTEG